MTALAYRSGFAQSQPIAFMQLGATSPTRHRCPKPAEIDQTSDHFTACPHRAGLGPWLRPLRGLVVMGSRSADKKTMGTDAWELDINLRLCSVATVKPGSNDAQVNGDILYHIGSTNVDGKHSKRRLFQT